MLQCIVDPVLHKTSCTFCNMHIPSTVPNSAKRSDDFLHCLVLSTVYAYCRKCMKLCAMHAQASYLASGAVGDVSTIPKAIHTDLLELGSRGVGVKSFP